MIDDVTKSIKSQLYERVTSPLLASFLMSWSIWNYRFLMILFSDNDVESKFYLIDHLHPNRICAHLDFWVFPLISSLFFLFLYPYPAKIVYEFWRTKQRELKEVRVKIDEETPLTNEESREIRENTRLTISKFQAVIDKLDRENQQLRNSAPAEGTETTQGNPSKESGLSFPKQLTDEELEILDWICASEDYAITEEMILARLTNDIRKAKHVIDRLEHFRYISKEFSNALSKYVFSATAMGRSYSIAAEYHKKDQ